MKRHVVEAHSGYHLCKICGARRQVHYKPWAYDYGKWYRDKKAMPWCPAKALEVKE